MGVNSFFYFKITIFLLINVIYDTSNFVTCTLIDDTSINLVDSKTCHMSIKYYSSVGINHFNIPSGIHCITFYNILALIFLKLRILVLPLKKL